MNSDHFGAGSVLRYHNKWKKKTKKPDLERVDPLLKSLDLLQL